MPPLPKAASSGVNQAETEDRKDALTAGGRGACEELGAPIPDGRAGLDERRGGHSADQDNDRRNHRNRRGRMHRDAQLAMVGIAIGRMDVRHLNDGEERQQDQAQESHSSESARLLEAAPAEMCLQPAQSTVLASDHPWLQGYRVLDAAGGGMDAFSARFLVGLYLPNLSQGI
jgi:hypothetical protein